MSQDKLALLKSLHLLDQIPDRELAALGDYLRARSLKDGELVFEQGGKAESLFFISSGRIRISKRVSGTASKDLALLGPGDCFGEMALLDPAPRSASAAAAGESVVLELRREDLDRWLEAHPLHAVGFFAELVAVQSRRLRRTSSELAMIFDLSSLLLEPVKSPAELLGRALERVLPHLDGQWSAWAALYNIFNEEMDLVAATAGGEPPRPPAGEPERWLDERSYYALLTGPARASGYLIFRAEAALSDEERGELGRALSAVARLLGSAVENVNFRTEDALRERLKASRQAIG